MLNITEGLKISHLRSRSCISKTECTNAKNKILKATFLNDDEEKILNYIQDLKSNINIHKLIIQDLLSSAKNEVMENKRIEVLEKQVQKVILDRDNYLSKSILLEETLYKYKEKISKLESQIRENSKTHLNDLSNKTQEINYYTERLHRISSLIKESSNIDTKTKDEIIKIANTKFTLEADTLKKEIQHVDFNPLDDLTDQSEQKSEKIYENVSFNEEGKNCISIEELDIKKLISDTASLKEIIIQLTDQLDRTLPRRPLPHLNTLTNVLQ